MTKAFHRDAEVEVVRPKQRPLQLLKESRLTVYLPPDLHQWLRVESVCREQTITEYVKELLEKAKAESRKI